MRNKHRFLVARISGSLEDTAKLSERDVLGELKESILINFGNFGIGSAYPMLQVRSVDPSSGVCIIRASHDTHRMVWISLTMMNNLRRKPIAINVEATAGCNRTLKFAAMQAYARAYKLQGLSEEQARTLLHEKEAELNLASLR
ncbi:unnamed protein product [Choristocarpus tenellus]